MTRRLPEGLYDLVLTEDLRAEIDRSRSQLRQLGRDESARLAEVLHRELVRALDEVASGDSPLEQLELVNDLLKALRVRSSIASRESISLVAAPAEVLTSIMSRGGHSVAPEVGLTNPWLFTAGKGSPSLLSELQRELAAADQVDILVSFITVSGVRKIREILRRVTAPGADERPPVRIRVLTTTYIGATDAAAVHELAELPGCEVRVSLDGRRTRLHAKAWIFHRVTGFGTTYVGSANLSRSALADGIEWTVKFTEYAHGDTFARATAHFDTLWEDPEFQRYDPKDASHRTALEAALKQQARTASSKSDQESGPTLISFFELEPKVYQQDMLEQLAIERSHGRHRNLVVAATGTGKTVVAAFDYRNTCRQVGGRPRLLFVAHRREILQQAQRTYREVLRDGGFGALLSGQDAPGSFDHLFATIDSVASQGLVERLGASHWHTIVIDECHRIAGERFDAFARAVAPKLLLGLTATPERTDGRSILPYFDTRPDGSPAVELRLWDALDLQLLAPFEYYGCNDETDFSSVPWNGVGEQQAVANLVSNNDVRAKAVLREWRRLSANPRKSRAIVFCVTVDHARFMAGYLERDGLPAVCVHGGSSVSEREDALMKLQSNEVCALVTVDLFNEGIDLPMVDALLLLRPTQSALLFQQQLGRGLRLAASKDTCLVLDFVGTHNAEFRYDRLLSGITGLTRREIEKGLEDGFSSLPLGCHVELQPQVRDRVLRGLRQQTQQHWRRMLAELTALAALRGRVPTLGAFLHEQGVELNDVYRDTGPRGWTALKRDAGLLVAEPGPEEEYLSQRVSMLRHRDAPRQIEALRLAATRAKNPESVAEAEAMLIQMLAYQLEGRRDWTGGPDAFLQRLRANPEVARELCELADVLEARTTLQDVPLPGLESSQLSLHAHYELREILTAVGWLTASSRTPFTSGVLPLKKRQLELLFVTLDKSTGFHAGISYHDYAISRTQFHWQSQNSAAPSTMVGKRYLESPANGWRFQLFVRTNQSQPFMACGPVRLSSATGERPMSIVWQLEHPLPAQVFQKFSVLRT